MSHADDLLRALTEDAPKKDASSSSLVSELEKLVRDLQDRSSQAKTASESFTKDFKRSRGHEREQAMRNASEATGEGNAYRDAARDISMILKRFR